MVAPRICQIIFLVGSLVWNLPAAAGQELATVHFHSETLEINYDPAMLPGLRPTAREPEMIKYYRQLEGRAYQPLLASLQQVRDRLSLNDWLFYQLVRETLTAAFPTRSRLENNLIAGFLLSKAGFDTRITYVENAVFLYAFTQDEIYQAPMIEDGGRTYVNLSDIHQRSSTGRSLYLLNFAPNPGGRAFQFYLPQLPTLKAQPVQRTLRFHQGDNQYEMVITLDQTITELMNDYPLIAEQQYLEVPFSRTLSASLLPQLRRLIEGKSKREALELLVTFTRNAFVYQEDKAYFGHSKPMIAEEVFHYPVSDCEDRSALFYTLTRDLLDLPMIIVAFEDHLTVAVALDQIEGTAIRFQDRDYFICDPTGPVNSSEIGYFPQGYEQQPFQIIGQYK